MKRTRRSAVVRTSRLVVIALWSALLDHQSLAFEGRIAATVWQGGQTAEVLYTVGQDHLRIEKTDTNWPHARNIVNLQTGDLTLLFPHNRSFVRLKTSAGQTAGNELPGASGPLPPHALPQDVRPGSGVGPAIPGLSAAVGPTNLPGVSVLPAMPSLPQPPAGLPPGGALGLGAMPAMPMMPMDMMDKPELKATGQKTNLLGYTCEKFELQQRGEVMEIWAADRLLPFQPWLANQPHRFGPRMIEEQWPALLKDRKLFPLRASLRFENGPERLSFAVKSITAEKIEDRDGILFQPPPDYHEIEPLPF